MPRLDYSLIINGNPATATGVVTPVSSPLDLLAQTTGSDWLTFNAIVGGWVRPRPWLEFGLAGQVLPANIVTKSNLTLVPADPHGTSRLGAADDHAAGGTTQRRHDHLAAAAHGARGRALPTPARHARALRRRAGRRIRDLVARQGVHPRHQRAGRPWRAGQSVPLGQIKIAKQWNDVFSVKLGGDVNLVPDRWTLRAGAYYETAVAPAAYANVDFPGAKVFGAALGGSLLLRQLEIALTYQLRYQPSFTVSEADARFYQQVPCVSVLQQRQRLRRALRPDTAARQRRHLRLHLAPRRRWLSSTDTASE